MAKRSLVLAFFGCVLLISPQLAAAPSIRPEVLHSYPHAVDAFTQGLLWYNGELFESTGLVGRSSVRRVRLEDGGVLQSTELPAEQFGEGLARVGQRLIQLTWMDGMAHVYDLESLTQIDTFLYEGEGWGLCYDGERLIMSDGSASLQFRDPTSFELLGEQPVVDEGVPVTQLNELECTAGLVLANVWQTDRIVVVDPSTGRVQREIDAAGLLAPAEAAEADVLNGIAYDADGERFFLTGKLWPRLFEVKLALDTNQPSTRSPSSSSCAIGCPWQQQSWWVAVWALGLLVVRYQRRPTPAPQELN